MKNSRVLPLIFGIFILYIGIMILLNSIGLNVHGGSIFSIFIILLGYFLLKKQKRIIGYILVAFGGLLFLDSWFGIGFWDVIGFILSIALIYYGYRMIRNKQTTNSSDGGKEDTSSEGSTRTVPPFEGSEDARNMYRILSPQKKHSLIGNCTLTGSRWELTDLDIWQGIGEVKIDLSHANIAENKSTIIINGWIGDVDIFVPYDLDIAIIARVSAGEIKVFATKESGVNRSIAIESSGYRQAIKRVEIIVNLFVGDIDVNYM